MALSAKKDSVFIAPPSTKSTTLKAFVVVAVTTIFAGTVALLVFLSSDWLKPFQNEVFLTGGHYEDKIQAPLDSAPPIYFVPVESDSHLIEKLKQLDLWSIEANHPIAPVVFNRFPDKIAMLPAKTRKRIFFNALIPSILIVQKEIYAERQYLQQIIVKLKNSPANIYFDAGNKSWQQNLNQHDQKFITLITKKYRDVNAALLLQKIDTIPASLALAQGAIESSWGMSRFASEANNLFGIWTWKKRGVVPAFRDIGKKHKVASYPSLLDSVRAYFLTINRLEAYREFRAERLRSKNSLHLAEKLDKYSERGEEYVLEISKVIRSNNLQIYDSCVLDRNYMGDK